MANEIITELILDLDKFRAQLKAAEAAGVIGGRNIGNSLGGGAKDGIDSLASSLKMLKSALATGAAALGIGTALHKMIEESSNAERSVAQLASAMSIAGGFSQGASARFEEYAHSLQNVTGISDDLITKNAALLVSIGHLSEQGLKGATKAALDLQAGLGGRIGVEDAFNLVAKAAEGNVAALGRYGIKIDETKSKSENFALVLAQIEKQFGGMASAQANTFSGAVARLAASFNDLFETAGRYITQSPSMIVAIDKTAKAFQVLGEGMTTVFGNEDILKEMISDAISFGKTVINWIIAPLEGFGRAIVMVYDKLATANAALILSLAVPLEKVMNLLAPFSESFANMSDTLSGFVEEQKLKLADLAQVSSDSAKEAFTTPLANALNESLMQLDTYVAASNEKLKAFQSNTTKAANGVSDAVKKASFDMNNMVGRGIASSVSVMTNAILKGQNMMKAFASTILSVFGDAAIQLGTFFIINGLAIEALKSISGLGAVAAGVALIALGTVMKSLGNAGASGAGAGIGAGAGADFGGGGGGGVNTSPNGGTGDQSEQEQRKANIQVVIQGHVLDRRETGLAIAEVIQDTFASNGLAFSTS